VTNPVVRGMDRHLDEKDLKEYAERRQKEKAEREREEAEEREALRQRQLRIGGAWPIMFS